MDLLTFVLISKEIEPLSDAAIHWKWLFQLLLFLLFSSISRALLLIAFVVSALTLYLNFRRYDPPKSLRD